MNFRIRTVLPLIAIVVGILALPAVAQAAPQHIVWKTNNRLEGVALDGFAGVSCPSQQECIAIDESGRVFSTNHPLSKNPAAWKIARIETTDALSGIACPSTKLCVAVDENGDVIWSHDPNGAKNIDWSTPARVDNARLPGGSYAGLAAIACPTVNLCVAVDNSTDGGILTTTDPTGPASDWHRVSVGNKTTFDTVNCHSATECVVGGSAMYFSVNPTSSSSWKKSTAPNSGFIESLACPSSKLCVGAGYNSTNQGIILATNKPTTASQTAYHRTNIIPDPPKGTEGMLDTVSCANTGFCIALDSTDNAYTSLHPGQFQWNTKPVAIRKNPSASRSVIFCRGDLCVAMDSRGVEETGVVTTK
jgi:hypothetical protein